MASPEPKLRGPASVVETACPLDCPDACSLAVTVQHRKVVQIDGSHKNPVTEGYICAKVRRFGERVYGPDRLLYPAGRNGPKGLARVERVPWDDALERIAQARSSVRDRLRSESVLPYSDGGADGPVPPDTDDATLL